MTRKSVYSIISVLFLTVLFLFSPFTRMTVRAGIKLPTMIVLTDYSKAMSIGDEFCLAAVASNGSLPTFRSSRSSIASVNTYGYVTAKKAGTCKITAKVRGAEASCLITVNPTTVTLNTAALTLFRTNTRQLTANVSTGHKPVWRSSRSSVATVDDNGMVTAVKHGTARITAKVDGVSTICTVTVKQPSINLSESTLALTTGGTQTLRATVSSGISPVWSTSNSNVVSVDNNGRVTALKKGRAYVYASEDGIKAKCSVTVKDTES